MSAIAPARADFAELQKHFEKWEIVKDVIDQQIDIMLNYRQSGHPGGSRSKVHIMVALLLGAMRWDIRAPEKRFGDRFVMVSGHVTPLLYATLAVLGEAMKTKYERTGDKKYFIDPSRIVLADDLKHFRRRHGLPGHCEMEGKTLFIKANTGPSGHGSPLAAGLAMGLKGGHADGVRVWAMEGEGGMTTGATHETRNSAFGLGLNNFVYLLDWNDFGIDDHPYSAIVPGTPSEWFAPYHFNIFGAEQGSEWGSVATALTNCVNHEDPQVRPNVCWFKTRKGRGYGKFDYASHGAPHKTNSDIYWQCRKEFQDKYGIEFANFGGAAPSNADEYDREWLAQINIAMDVLRTNDALVDFIADRLVEVGDSVPDDADGFRLKSTTALANSSGPRSPFEDAEWTNFETYPAEMWATPGEKKPNRAALATWGAFVNSWAKKKYGRPLFLVCSADLAGSTNIAGFADDFSTEMTNFGKYDRLKNPDGTLLPQGITEFANSGLICGMATANLSPKPFDFFDGFYGACSTYGSFSYLKYGPMRLFSQTAQDSQIKLGKVLWIAGHSGPETADDSRTHFGIFAPSVTQLFPEGHVIDLHPYEYNEVPVLLAAAFAANAPIVALHLTRPPVAIPDRAKLGMAHYFDAAKGAYIIRDYDANRPKQGCIFVQGTASTQAVVESLEEIGRRFNVKIVAALSPQLFALQPAEYREKIANAADWADSMCITNRARRAMYHWMKHEIAYEYSMGSDFDDRWRTGGNLDDVLDEARLTPPYILEGIERFVTDRAQRLGRLRQMVDLALGSAT